MESSNGRPADCNISESIACFEEAKAMGRVWQALTAEQPDHEDLFFWQRSIKQWPLVWRFRSFPFLMMRKGRCKGTILFDDGC